MSAHTVRWVAVILALLLAAMATTYIASSSVPVTTAHAADRDCDDFRTQKKAQRFFRKHNPRQDPHRLDDDGDRIACEFNDCPCSRKWHRQHGKGKAVLSRRV